MEVVRDKIAAPTLFDVVAPKPAEYERPCGPTFRECLEPKRPTEARTAERPAPAPERTTSRRESEPAEPSPTASADADPAKPATRASTEEDPSQEDVVQEESAQEISSDAPLVVAVATPAVVTEPATSTNADETMPVAYCGDILVLEGEPKTKMEPAPTERVDQIADQALLDEWTEGVAPSDALAGALLVSEATGEQPPSDEDASKGTPAAKVRRGRSERAKSDETNREIASSENQPAAATAQNPELQILEGEAAPPEDRSPENANFERAAIERAPEPPQQATETSGARQSSADVATDASALSNTAQENSPSANREPAVQVNVQSPLSKPPASLLRAKASVQEGSAAAAEIDPARFLNRVVKAFHSAEQREGEVRLRLHPAELGSLRIEVKILDGVLSAQLQAETTEARTALVDNLPQLRERLAEQGIRIDKFDVDLMDHSDRQQQQQSFGEERQTDRPPLPEPRRPRQEPGDRRKGTRSSDNSNPNGLNVIV